MAGGKDKLFERFSAERVKTALRDTPVVMVNGPRQCGKTTLARRFVEGQRTYITLDDDTQLAAARADPAGFMRGIERAIIDEIGKDGPAVVDFLGLAAPWKAEWTEEVLPHSSCFIFRKGLRGRVLHFWRFGILAVGRSAARHPSLEPAARAAQRWRKPTLSPAGWRRSVPDPPAGA